MLPETFKNSMGNVVGVIVALSLGKYRASIRVGFYPDPEEKITLHKTFDQIEEARSWIRTNALIETGEAA